nr:PREDICTED: probable pectinesterase/pectinesterase inhibitor 17 [Daucus carota subsp. sativus]
MERNLAISAALNEAVQVHHMLSSMDSSSLEVRTQSAWADCLELYEESIQKLNRSMFLTNTMQNNIHVQTLLSSALTDQETCKDGFIDFSLAATYSKLFPLNESSENLCKILGMNKAVMASQTSGLASEEKSEGWLLRNRGLPEWLSESDRRILQEAPPPPDLVVAQDGSGNYRTIGDAVATAAAAQKGGKRFVIYVKRGVYKEYPVIQVENLTLLGDGIEATIVTGNRSVADGATTSNSATFDIYFSLQFYRDCDIYGTVDFIFGNAIAVLQNCKIFVRKPMTQQTNVITAQGRTCPDDPTGIVLHECFVTAAPDLKPVQGMFKTFLGRPWKEYSRTVVMKTSLDDLIDPSGWTPWNSSNFYLDTLYYGEFNNTGRGADTLHRVNWPGYHIITNVGEALKFTVGSFLNNIPWLGDTGVPFTPGL